ncbi:hypothetical protein M513_11022 [Trichuris suis]|uniref:Mos1 transposase HTH domain-containing protein n=1 Tax=Trichuris suis TaxID=68888 RepID=A0A085LSY3_9BILA|nr:hypothetical protein M513_11022 [Trichuris suis]
MDGKLRRAILLYEFKSRRSVREAVRNINATFGPGSLQIDSGILAQEIRKRLRELGRSAMDRSPFNLRYPNLEGASGVGPNAYSK